MSIEEGHEEPRSYNCTEVEEHQVLVVHHFPELTEGTHLPVPPEHRQKSYQEPCHPAHQDDLCVEDEEEGYIRMIG